VTRVLIKVVSFAVALFIAGCRGGGGGGGSTSPPLPTVYTISGTVTSSGAGLSGVTMTLGGTAPGTATTDASGNYSFTGPLNGSYTVTPSRTSYTFTPTSLAVTVNGANATAQNFTATFTPLLTPYVNESDMVSINGLFNSRSDSGSPKRTSDRTASIHDGLDIYPNGNLKPFRAVCSGRVQWVIMTEDDVVVFLVCNSTYTVDYAFEPQPPQTGPRTGQIQLRHIAVVAGQAVSQGDIIGHLYVPDATSPHI